jgi:hypothetical protein
MATHIRMDGLPYQEAFSAMWKISAPLVPVPYKKDEKYSLPGLTRFLIAL